MSEREVLRDLLAKNADSAMVMASRKSLAGVLDALERAEAERDQARAEVKRLGKVEMSGEQGTNPMDAYEHRWTTSDGVEHVAYGCRKCNRWFDSPSVHVDFEDGHVLGTTPSDIRERVARSTITNIAVLNRLEPHLGCVVCRGPLTDGRCPKCQGAPSE